MENKMEKKTDRIQGWTGKGKQDGEGKAGQGKAGRSGKTRSQDRGTRKAAKGNQKRARGEDAQRTWQPQMTGSTQAQQRWQSEHRNVNTKQDNERSNPNAPPQTPTLSTNTPYTGTARARHLHK